jgi:DNA polymerase III epsilon subunit-like protein
MKLFSDNIIFWDSEFTDLDPYKGEILSLGFIKPTGEELYLELEHTGEVSGWVKEKLLPELTQPKISRQGALEKIIAFLGPNRPFLVAYVNQFDAIYLYKLLGTTSSTKEYPFHWIHVDFASILFAQGIDPERYNQKRPDSLFAEYQIDISKYNKHNALDDARMLRDLYIKMNP